LLLGGNWCEAADLQFAAAAVDAGEVRCGAPLSQRFAFVNRGVGPVEIVEVRAGCGCLTPRLPQRIYQPGETGVLLLEVNTLSQDEGDHAWTCQVHYRSAGTSGQVPLEIRGRVIAEVTVRPAVLTIFAEGAIAHDVILTDRRPQPLVISELGTTSPRLTPRLVEQGRNSDGHWVRRFRLEAAADYPDGRHDEAFHILTRDPIYRDLKVPVTIVKRLPRRVTVLPAEVKLEAASGQALPSRLLRLRDRQDEQVMVEQITADDPAIACQWAPGPDKQATVKVRIDAARLTGDRLDSAIRITLGQPVRETIVVPVRCHRETSNREPSGRD
jgi:hypothetical protein